MANSAASADERNLGDGERIASVLGGAALLLYGHCPLYRALGLSSAGAPDDPSVIDKIEQAAHDGFPARP